MGKTATGNAFQSRGRWYVRLRVGTAKGDRLALQLPATFDGPAAETRREILADAAKRLRAASVARERIVDYLERLAAAEGKDVKTRLAAIDIIERRESADTSKPGAETTYEQIGKAWTSGELARQYPDHVRAKSAKTAADDAALLERYVYPVLGPRFRAADFTVDHALTVLRSLPAPPALHLNTRRKIIQRALRVVSLAVFPLRLLAANPIPRNFLPRSAPEPARQALYPDEERALLRCPKIALHFRIFYGFLTREGSRLSEGAAFIVDDFDLDRGAVSLGKNKTRDPRSWALSPGVAAALRAWLAWRAARGETITGASLMFPNTFGKPHTPTGRAKWLRRHLRLAGVARSELFKRTPESAPIRLHDTRATHITVGLACGRTEAEISAKTGHRSSAEIHGYRRLAQKFEQLGLGDLDPLDGALPELAGAGGGGPESMGSGTGSAEAGHDGNPAETPRQSWGRSKKPSLQRNGGGIADPGKSRGTRGAAGQDSGGRPGGAAHSAGAAARSGARDGGPEGAPAGPGAPAPVLQEAFPALPGATVGTSTASPRAVLAAQLAGAVAQLMAAGDLAGAKVAADALQALLGASEAGTAPVVDLAAVRRERGR